MRHRVAAVLGALVVGAALAVVPQNGAFGANEWTGSVIANDPGVQGVVADGDGHIFLWSTGPATLDKRDAITGALVPSFDASGAGLTSVGEVTADGAGSLYVSDPDADRVVRLDAGTGAKIPSFNTAAAALQEPSQIEFSEGFVFVRTEGPGQRTVLKLDAVTGAVASDLTALLVNSDEMASPNELAADGQGNLYVSGGLAGDDFSMVKVDVSTDSLVPRFRRDMSERGPGTGGGPITASGARLYEVEAGNLIQIDTATGFTIVGPTTGPLVGFDPTTDPPIPYDADVDEAGRVFLTTPQGDVWRFAPGATSQPDRPLDVKASAGPEGIAVTWNRGPRPEPAMGGLLVTKYTVTATPGGRTCSTVLKPAAFGTSFRGGTGWAWKPGAKTCTIKGLSSGTSYTFRVTATNAQGESEPSTASNAVVPKASPPSASPDAASALPAVGTTTGEMAGWAVALVTFGAAMVALARRRRSLQD